jgi:acetyl-CoA carboxylase / biotin carboxylase 1
MPEINGHGAKANGSAAPVANGKASYATKYKLADHFIGGNKLDNAPESKVKDFVAKHDGHTVITNVRFLRIPRGIPWQTRLARLPDRLPLTFD